MKIMIKEAALGLSVILPAVASAQSSSRADLAYCAALANDYETYVGHGLDSGHRVRGRGDAEGQVAVAQCRQGNAAAAIPVLERKLLNAGFKLPRRG